MSGYTMTQCESLYSVSAASTPVTTPTTTPGASMFPGLPPIVIPGGYFNNATGNRASSLKLEIWGLITTTATIPTFGFSLYVTTATPAVWATGQVLLATTAAVTMNTTAGTYPFHLQAKLKYRTPNPQGSPATGVLIAMMRVDSPAIYYTNGQSTSYATHWSPPAGTLGNMTSFEPDLQYFLWPSYYCSAGTANNYMTTEMIDLFGEN